MNKIPDIPSYQSATNCVYQRLVRMIKSKLKFDLSRLKYNCSNSYAKHYFKLEEYNTVRY